LKREGLMREVIRHIQNARKQAGLNVDDHITLYLETASSELQEAIKEHQPVIASETLADAIVKPADGYETQVKVEGDSLRITLARI
jgi:isoleucyl-tRNA synthetase